jgi:hypothetical protein
VVFAFHPAGRLSPDTGFVNAECADFNSAFLLAFGSRRGLFIKNFWMTCLEKFTPALESTGRRF